VEVIEMSTSELEMAWSLMADEGPDLVTVAERVAALLAGRGTGTRPERQLRRLLKEAGEIRYQNLGPLGEMTGKRLPRAMAP
jgi:hypothetical protein